MVKIMWEKLNHNIDKMLMLTKNLLLAVEKQHQKLLNNDKIGFDEIIKEQSEITGKLLMCEKEKETIINEIMYNQKINLANLTLLQTVEFAKDKKQELMLKVLELNAVGEKIRNYIAKNKTLNDRAIRFINFNINVITGTTADTTYNAQNKGTIISKKKIFDQSI